MRSQPSLPRKADPSSGLSVSLVNQGFAGFLPARSGTPSPPPSSYNGHSVSSL